MAKTLEDLREQLFATIQGLRDNKIDIARAKTISELAQTVINSAKAEVDYLRVTEQPNATLPVFGKPAPGLPDADGQTPPSGIRSVITHKIRG